jgi:hypothetical protein
VHELGLVPINSGVISTRTVKNDSDLVVKEITTSHIKKSEIENMGQTLPIS